MSGSVCTEVLPLLAGACRADRGRGRAGGCGARRGASGDRGPAVRDWRHRGRRRTAGDCRVHQPALPAGPGRETHQHCPQHGGGQAGDGWALPCWQGARVRDHRAQRRPDVLHGPSEPEPGRASHTPTSRRPACARSWSASRTCSAAAIGTTTTTSSSSPATSRRTGLLTRTTKR